MSGGYLSTQFKFFGGYLISQQVDHDKLNFREGEEL
jgi:hypothetical protein